jgi:GNAT superfamily N-acetyltransferase
MTLRKAIISDAPVIWIIIQQAIEQRKLEGSAQWQNGYPNKHTIHDDIEKGYGFVLEDEDVIVAYAAIIFEKEPAYETIEGNWLTHGDYVVVHRVATSDAVKGKGIATRLFEMIEDVSLKQNVYSIKVDTFFDNGPMMRILDKLNYTYCGKVYFQSAWCKAYEKVLKASAQANFQILMLPFLENLKEGEERSMEEVKAELIRFVEFTDQELKSLDPENNKQEFQEAIALAQDHLRKAGLIETKEDGVKITSFGKMILSKRLNSIDVDYLRRLLGYI